MTTARAERSARKTTTRDFRGRSFECFELAPSDTSLGVPKNRGRKPFGMAERIGSYDGGHTYLGSPLGEHGCLYFKVPNGT